MKRSELLRVLAERIVAVQRPHPTRVGIDGVDGVGKTTMADELAEVVRMHGRTVVRASVDGFHNPRSVRYQRGRTSAEGYFFDSFNYPELITTLLSPLGLGGTRRHRRAVFNYRIDSPVDTPYETAPPDAILLFDGVFLLRPELIAYWDLSIFLDAPFEVTVARMAQRDGSSSSQIDAPENRRYVEGQQLYLKKHDPRQSATILVNHEHLESPELVTRNP